MANLIIRESNAIPAGILESTLDATNWRALGSPYDRHLYLVLANFETYLIPNLRMGKFLEMVRLNLDFQVRCEFISIVPACPTCAGSGITDWISKIVDRSNKIKDVDRDSFKRDTTGKLYKAPTSLLLNTERKSFICYYSTAVLPEAMEYCEDCNGNGTLHFSREVEDGTVEVTSYERM